MELSEIRECVERALMGFGLNMKKVTYASFQNNEGKLSDEILSDPEAFARALKTSFRSGYNLAERAIIKEILIAVGEAYPPRFASGREDSLNLIEVLEYARTKVRDHRAHRDSSEFLMTSARLETSRKQNPVFETLPAPPPPPPAVIPPTLNGRLSPAMVVSGKKREAKSGYLQQLFDNSADDSSNLFDSDI